MPGLGILSAALFGHLELRCRRGAHKMMLTVSLSFTRGSRSSRMPSPDGRLDNAEAGRTNLGLAWR
jgi:hypothetical protein